MLEGQKYKILKIITEGDWPEIPEKQVQIWANEKDHTSFAFSDSFDARQCCISRTYK